MSDRDNPATRENIQRDAADFRKTVHRNGNPSYTQDQAVRRVSEARRKGDMKRENGNR